MIKIICIFVMLITTNEDIKKQSCHLHCQSAYSTQSGKPLYLTGVFIMEKLEYYKNLSLENLTGYDKDGNFHVERWEDIYDYEGSYKGSTFGRVKSLARSANKCRVDRILKQSISRKGYCFVGLCKGDKKKTKSVHRLVANLFILNHENKPEVNHDDTNKTNNCVWNLIWSTNRENVSHFQLTKDRSSQYTGVYFHKASGRWMAYIDYNRKRYYLGYHSSELKAHLAYRKALKELEDTGSVTSSAKKSSKHKGVSFNKQKNKWTAFYGYGKNMIYLGDFKTEAEAYEARQEKERLC